MAPPLRAAAPFEVRYRPMIDDDLGFMAQLYASTRAEELAGTGWPEEAKAAFLQQQHEAQHRHYMSHNPAAEWLVIERGKERIGRLYLREDPTRFHIIDIALVSHSRGQGIGEAILRDILGQARDVGKAVSIHVEKFNPARRLYERIGFVPVEDHGAYDLLVAEIATPSARQ